MQFSKSTPKNNEYEACSRISSYSDLPFSISKENNTQFSILLPNNDFAYFFW